MPEKGAVVKESNLYNSTHPLLIPGRRYAWRVKAALSSRRQNITSL
jgi:hypothetical protein